MRDGANVVGLTRRLRTSLYKAQLWPAFIPAAIALVVVILGTVFAERQNNAVYRQNVRAEVLNHVSLIRSRLEGNINANIQLLRGLVSVISAEPDMDQQRFSALARNLFNGENQLRSVAAAPGLVVEMVYPLEGNRAALGLDYRANDDQRAAALRVRNTGRLVVAGPVDLVQGGVGFVARIPVYTEEPRNGTRFWGVVSAVVDATALYQDSNLYFPSAFDVAIRGKDATGRSGEPFFGPEEVWSQNPVMAEVRLPFGSWQIGAVPAGGWDTTPENLWTIRGFGVLAAILVVVPMIVAGWLFGERFSHLRELKARGSELQRMSERLELALGTSHIGVWENDTTRDKLYWDRRMRELYGAPLEGEVDYPDWSDRLHPDDRDEAVEAFWDAIASRRPYHSEFRIVLDDGEVRTIRAMGTVNQDEQGNVRIVGVNWDISRDVQLAEQLRRERSLSEMRNAELEAAKARIEHNALHDSLTGLPNRRYLDELLAGRRNETDGSGISGMLHIDLDRFKQINDTLGHAAGDAMLIHAAGVLRENVRASDFVARIGGDEFVVVCMSEADEEHLEELAARLVECMRQPVNYQGRECRFGVSIGIAGAETVAASAQELLINADIALYRAKNEGRNGYRFFSKELHRAAVNTKQVADEILSGLEQKQFIAHFQGQFDATTHEITGVEALARWKHPEKGLLTPDAFIEVAEDLNVMADIDATILEQSIAQFDKWRRNGVNVPRVAVNVSARRLRDENLMTSLRGLDFELGTLAFELVESTFLDSSDELMAWNLDQIRELGIDIEIDDFGTGYASIVSLMQLMPDRLKIARQLVQPTLGSPGQRELVRSIVNIGSSLGISAIAEGVETMEHAAILRDLGCGTLQGYALARPMSAGAFTRFARQGGARKKAA